MSSLRYVVPFGRLESVMYLALTTQRLFVVSNNAKRCDTVPVRSLRYGTDLSLGRDLMTRPTLTAKMAGQRSGKRYTLERRRCRSWPRFGVDTPGKRRTLGHHQDWEVLIRPTRRSTLTLIAAGVVLFLLSASGQDNGYWKSGPSWLGAIGWFGFLICLLLLIASAVYTVVSRSRHHDRPSPQ